MRIQKATRRTAIGITDQLVYSVNNFALTVLVARNSDVSTFGTFSLIIASFLIVSAMNRGLTSETYTVRLTIKGTMSMHAEAACINCSLALAASAAVLSVALGLILDGVTASSLFVLAAVLPGLLTQDTCRYIAIARGRPSVALVSDLVSNLVFGGIVATLILASGPLTVSELLAAWGIGATLGAGQALVALRVRPTVWRPMAWLARHRGMSFRFASENLLTQANQQGSSYVVAAAAGLADTAALRGAQTIFVPPSILIFGIQTASTPELVKLAHSSTTRLRRVVVLMTVAFTLVQGTWFALVMITPANIGEELFGSTWASAHDLFIAWGIAQVISSVGVPPFVALRAMGAAGLTLSTRFAAITINLTSMIVGAIAGGAMGVAIASAIASPIQSALWWRTMRGGLADFRQKRQAARHAESWRDITHDRRRIVTPRAAIDGKIHDSEPQHVGEAVGTSEDEGDTTAANWAGRSAR